MKHLITGLALWLPWLAFGQIKDLPKPINHKENTALLKIANTVYDYGYIQYEDGLKFNPTTFFTKNQEAFGLTEKDEIVQTRTTNSIDGSIIYQFQQYHRGHKVKGGAMNMRVKDGKLLTSNGRFRKNLPDSPAVLPPEDAVAIAIQAVPATLYMWDSPQDEAALQATTGNAEASWFPKPKLNYSWIADDTHEGYRLAYDITVITRVPHDEIFVQIDAITGAVLKKGSIVSDATAETMYSGIVDLETTFIGSGFQLEDLTRGPEAIITIEDGGSPVFNTNNTWTSSSWTEWSDDKQALDAHWGTGVFYDFFEDYGFTSFNLEGPPGANKTNIVHRNDVFYQSTSTYYPEQYLVKYGDNPVFGTDYPQTCPEIVFHEWGHSYMYYHFNVDILFFGFHESGVINEAMADIIAFIVNYYELGEDPDWLTFDECAHPSAISGLRNMADPNAHGYPAGIGDSPYLNAANFHDNSTIVSRWFYLCVEGGSGMTVQNNGLLAYGASGAPYPYEVGALGMDAPTNIVFEAITLLSMTSTPWELSFGTFRDYTIQAAKDLYGPCSNELQQVMNAWYAMGNMPLVDDGIPSTPSTLMMDPDEICDVLIDDPGTTYMFESHFKVNAPGVIYCDNGEAEIANGSTAICRSAQEINLLPGFTAKTGSDFRAYIGTCLESSYPKAFHTPSHRNKFDDITQEAIGELQLYPNPSSGRFTVEKVSLPNGPFSLTIWTLDGREVFRESYNPQQGDLRVDVSGLQLSGSYLLSIQNEEGFVANGRILFNE